MTPSKINNLTEIKKNQDEDTRASKSEKKREVLALRACAEYICNLKSEQQLQLPLSISITNALLEYKRLKNKNAQQRHIQFLTKILIDTENLEEIEKAVERFQHPHLHQQKVDRAVENSFAKIISADSEKSKNEISAIINQNSSLDRQMLAQLIRNAHKEYNENAESISQNKQPEVKSSKKHQQKLKKMLRNHFNHLEISHSQF
jgi:ribosome-associated protein